ncbi:MAG: glycogen/starch synthase, partial [Muribaculaceae bacterium]|nr:glycogen/starch synthase [Muribaculaceae bacterium]
LSGMNIIIDDTDHQLIIKVATLQPSRMQVYFIDNDDYFQHHVVKDIEIRQTPEDNDERIMFYVRGVIETVKKLRWEPAIIQNVGWITALAPLYLKKIYDGDPSFRSSKIVYSLVDDNFEGTLDPRFVEKLLMDGFDKEDLKEIADAPVDYKALNRLAMRYSDGIVQVLPDVDPELVEFAKSLGVPFMEYQGDENLAQNYLDFYNQL